MTTALVDGLAHGFFVSRQWHLEREYTRVKVLQKGKKLLLERHQQMRLKPIDQDQNRTPRVPSWQRLRVIVDADDVHDRRRLRSSLATQIVTVVQNRQNLIGDDVSLYREPFEVAIGAGERIPEVPRGELRASRRPM